MTKSDSILWMKMKSGSKAALASIYRSEVSYLYNYCHRLTHDKALIEDAIQELFVEIWNKRTSIGKTDSIRPYLTTSIRRKVIHHLNKRNKKSSESEIILSHKSEDAIDAKIIEKEHHQEENKRLMENMQKLSSRQREAIYLKYYQDHSYNEICEIMDINYQSARNLVSSGLRKMKEFLLKNPLLWFLLSTNLLLTS